MRLRTSKVKQDTIDETIFSCYLNSFEPKSPRTNPGRTHTHTQTREQMTKTWTNHQWNHPWQENYFRTQSQGMAQNTWQCTHSNHNCHKYIQPIQGRQRQQWWKRRCLQTHHWWKRRCLQIHHWPTIALVILHLQCKGQQFTHAKVEHLHLNIGSIFCRQIWQDIE